MRKDLDQITEENLRLVRIELKEWANKFFRGTIYYKRVPINLFSREELIILVAFILDNMKKTR